MRAHQMSCRKASADDSATGASLSSLAQMSQSICPMCTPSRECASSQAHSQSEPGRSRAQACRTAQGTGRGECE
jgi:hypothetical protein